jgi:hypothetical protein
VKIELGSSCTPGHEVLKFSLLPDRQLSFRDHFDFRGRV